MIYSIIKILVMEYTSRLVVDTINKDYEDRITTLIEDISWKDSMLFELNTSYITLTKEYDICMQMLNAAKEEIIRLRTGQRRTEPLTKKRKISEIGNEEFDSDFFDQASDEWNKNKRRDGACYVYKCINPKCDQDGEFDFDMCCFNCFDKVCRNTPCKSVVTNKNKHGYCNDCFKSYY